MPQTDKQIKGEWGEDHAQKFLVNNGYEIIECNFRAGQMGEIDIIAWHKKSHFGKTLCFIEVKTRKFDDGSAERAVDFRKQGHIFRVARAYCIDRGINTDRTPIQFEQISIYTRDGESEIRHYVIPVE